MLLCVMILKMLVFLRSFEADASQCNKQAIGEIMFLPFKARLSGFSHRTINEQHLQRLR